MLVPYKQLSNARALLWLPLPTLVIVSSYLSSLFSRVREDKRRSRTQGIVTRTVYWANLCPAKQSKSHCKTIAAWTVSRQSMEKPTSDEMCRRSYTCRSVFGYYPSDSARHSKVHVRHAKFVEWSIPFLKQSCKICMACAANLRRVITVPPLNKTSTCVNMLWIVDPSELPMQMCCLSTLFLATSRSRETNSTQMSSVRRIYIIRSVEYML